MKPINRALDDGKIKAILEAERMAALGAGSSSDLSAQRIKALDYYMGDMSETMPAEDGLSKAVSTDVQDTVEGILPIILDVFISNDDVVTFNPHGPNDEAAAEQETDYVNHVFYQKNNGFLTLYNAIKDGLLSKNGFVKWWMEPEESRTRERYEGLDEDSYAALMADDDVKVIDTEQYSYADPVTQQPGTCYNAVAERVSTKMRPRIAAVPPEEILISKSAHNLPNAPYMAHIQPKAQADLIALFPEYEEEIRNAPASSTALDNQEANNRQSVQDHDGIDAPAAEVNKDMRLIEVAEHYIRLPLEKDKVARRYKITTIGTKHTILDVEEVTAWPFATATPIIMPHRVIGRSVADLTMDIQEIKTSLLRATLNNAYYANNQRLEVSETHASENTLDDILNNRVGGIIRTKMPGGLNPVPTQSIGNWVAPIIEYMDGVRETRTGVSKSNQGLDADALAHSRTGAVTRLMDAAEMRIKLIARIIAETLIVDMFRGLHQMLQEYSEESEVVKLRGGWTPVAPREWAKRDHMTVSLPLGGASKQMLMGFFEKLLQGQQQVIQFQGGADGPLVTMENIYNTFKQTVKLAGLKSVDPFFTKPPPPNPNAPKPPNPEMVKAQAQAQATQQKTQAQSQAAQAKAQSDQQNDAARLHADLQAEEVKAQFARQREQDEFQHKAALDQMKFDHDTQMGRMKAENEMAIAQFKARNEAALNAQQAELQAKQGVGTI